MVGSYCRLIATVGLLLTCSAYSATEPQKTPAQFGTEKAPIFVKQLQPSRSVEEIQEEVSREEAREAHERDLVAYTSNLADYTRKLFEATGLLALMTGALVFLGFMQIRDARRSLDTAEKSAAAAQKSAAVAEEALTKVERPWVVASDYFLGVTALVNEGGDPEDSVPGVQLHFRNVGRMPGIITGVRYGVAPAPSLAEQPNYANLKDMVTGRAAVESGGCFDTPYIYLLEHLDQQLLYGESPVLIFGIVKYKSLSGETHETGFMFQPVSASTDRALLSTFERYEWNT